VNRLQTWILRLLACIAFALSAVPGAAAFRYREGTHQGAALKYVNDLPVLLLRGTPQEMGDQAAVLTPNAVKQLMDYPKKLLQQRGRGSSWPKMQKASENLWRRVPDDYQRELDAFARKAGVQRDDLIAANTLVDILLAVGCSSLIVEGGRSATGAPLFGRNFDFYSLGMLDEYSLVTIYRPKGKHAFASVGFPGMIGCFSGINDAGLALAVHRIYAGGDGSPKFNPRGTPYLFCCRRVLEECATVEEAQRLLQGMERTTLMCLVLCDRRRGAVFEISPKNVIARRGKDGICICTNHFRTETMAFKGNPARNRGGLTCPRYRTLIGSRDLKQLDVAAVAGKLHAANQGGQTLQTMIFEPAPLVLHLAIGEPPSSALPLRRLVLEPLLRTCNKSAGGHPP